MSLLEDVVINTKSAINTFSKKAGELVDISKLKINAAEVQNEISKKFELIGKVVYDSDHESLDNNPQIETLKNQLDYLFLKLNDIHEQIAAMKKKCKCKECGALNELNSNYCCKCGTKIDLQNCSSYEVKSNDETSQSDEEFSSLDSDSEDQQEIDFENNSSEYDKN